MSASWTKRFAATKSETALLVLFIPSVDREQRSFGKQRYWVKEALRTLGEYFDGATAFPRGLGVWKDRERGGTLIWDTPVIVHCYTNEESAVRHAPDVVGFLRRLGHETNQGAVGFVFQNEYFELRAPFKKKE